jgi:AcrR family transcriptional regulator
MPRIWADTIDSHRRQVQDAILDTTAELIVEQGPMSVTMSTIAARVGIGRATLYKYFPDLESILIAWHTRNFGHRLAHVEALSESTSVTLHDVMTFVRTQRERHRRHGPTDLLATLAHALAGNGTRMPDTVEREIHDALRRLMRQLARRSEIRTDLDADVLARWLFHVIHAPDDVDNDAVVSLLADSLAPTAAQRSQARQSRAH